MASSCQCASIGEALCIRFLARTSIVFHPTYIVMVASATSVISVMSVHYGMRISGLGILNPMSKQEL